MCRNDKERLVTKEQECQAEKKTISERKVRCREEERACHEDKNNLMKDKQNCEIRESQLLLDLEGQEDLIMELRSQLTALNSTCHNPEPNDWPVAEPGSTCRLSGVDIPGMLA